MARTLDVRLEKMGGASWGLHVRNSGGSPIPELTVELEGEPIDRHPAFIENQPDGAHVRDLPAGGAVGYLLVARDEAHQPPYSLRIVHTDPEGVSREYSATIG